MNDLYTDITSANSDPGSVIVQTDSGAKDGQNKCPKCGATDISVNINNGHLRCNFCRHEFELEKVSGLVEDISQIEGRIIGSGANDIVADINDVVTFKCESCGAEVVIDTAEATNARCHWCRNILSINQQIPNGAVPDVVLTFAIRKEDAKLKIEKFVRKRKFYALPKFKQEFTTENIMGVYFPYMVVDVNAHAYLAGQGEHLVRKYSVGTGDNKRYYYEADLYNVERDFDILISGLTVESSSDKLNKNASNKTTNIINSIMPFDIENCVKWNANYLRGFSSEKRDTNIEQLSELVNIQSKDISKFAVNDTLQYYDRGVRWDLENLDVKGQQWKAAYLPVWLYSYQQVNGSKKLLHYVAVNARTKEIMGSVPLDKAKLFLFSCMVEIFGFLGMMYVDFDYRWVLLSIGFIYYFIIYNRYRNRGARHYHETETDKEVSNLKEFDQFVQNIRGLTNSTMEDANNKMINGQNALGSAFDNIIKNTINK